MSRRKSDKPGPRQAAPPAVPVVAHPPPQPTPADDPLRRAAGLPPRGATRAGVRAGGGPAAGAAAESQGILATLREWGDALVIAFVAAMFVRMFVVELFKIPSGSMTPTLFGDVLVEGNAIDEKGKPGDFLIIAAQAQARGIETGEFQVFRKDEAGAYRYDGKRRSPDELSIGQRGLIAEKKLRLQEHRILVNKFRYWFGPPRRGDITVFKVPFPVKNPAVSADFANPGGETTYKRADGRTFARVPAYNRATSVYVKRLTGLPGEELTVNAGDPAVYVDGKPLADPPVFSQMTYQPPLDGERAYRDKVPPGQVFMFGDNSDNSLDSRYWGGVPIENLRGKAFFRYWPLPKVSFLK